ncbi:MAG: hypothetical protein MAG715_00888 [Methanonatronarchaeales archaeon]|nr:hypothetical protein [Methanonatronarchaeales archaeon]
MKSFCSRRGLSALAAVLFLVSLSTPAAAANSPDTWSALYGGDGGEEMEGVWATDDGGFVVVGATESFGEGKGDAWVVKLDGAGGVEWQKTYGGSGTDFATDVRGTDGGGYVVAGWTESFGEGKSDFWLLKLDGGGDVEWQRTYGSEGEEQAWSVDVTGDGGYVVAGGSTSFGDGGLLGSADADFWVLKLDSSGDVEWQKVIGGPENDGGGGEYGEYVVRVLEDEDGNYVVASDTDSFGSGGRDVWVVKLDSVGEVMWQRAYGGQYGESTWMFREAADGGYIVPGVTETFSPDESGDLWVLKLDTAGDVEWERVYGLETYWDEAISVGATEDGGAIVGGYYEEGEEDWDLTLLRVGPDGDLQWSRVHEYGWDWPNAVQELPDGGYVMAGVGALYDQDLPEDLWVMRLSRDGTIGSCGHGRDLSLTVEETDATVTETDASVRDTYATPRESAAVVGETSAEPDYLCGGSMGTDPGTERESPGAPEDSSESTGATGEADVSDEEAPGFSLLLGVLAMFGVSLYVRIRDR